MGEKITAALRTLGYTSVGTIEFLMDEDGSLYFIEMNTRIQVEHPVTEMLTGRDLVRLQIRIAANEPLPFQQSDVSYRGHAIECRINAEDPDTFAPSPGLVTALNFPGGAGVRVDTHMTQGAMVAPFYDSMLAKVIVHDVDRPQGSPANAIRIARDRRRRNSNQRPLSTAPARTSRLRSGSLRHRHRRPHAGRTLITSFGARTRRRGATDR